MTINNVDWQWIVLEAKSLTSLFRGKLHDLLACEYSIDRHGGGTH